MRLKDKIAIVVGAGQTSGDTIGNGRATAILFAREGAKVMLVDNNLDSAEETQDMIAKEKGESVAFKADVSCESDCEKIEIYHSLPDTVDPEKTDPVTWYLSYRLPLAVLRKYCSIDEPRPGAQWRANFYKCADETSHPHWLTWSPVNRPEPDFHLPQFFGIVAFE